MTIIFCAYLLLMNMMWLNMLWCVTYLFFFCLRLCSHLHCCDAYVRCMLCVQFFDESGGLPQVAAFSEGAYLLVQLCRLMEIRLSQLQNRNCSLAVGIYRCCFGLVSYLHLDNNSRSCACRFLFVPISDEYFMQISVS